MTSKSPAIIELILRPILASVIQKYHSLKYQLIWQSFTIAAEFKPSASSGYEQASDILAQALSVNVVDQLSACISAIPI
jgi:hypothetical protein